MFARLRAPLLSLLLHTAFSAAAGGVLSSSSVTYCEPPESLLIQQFDFKFFSENSSVWFNISAESVQSIDVSANLLLNVYGLKPVNITENLCDILGGALCPLPQYNFVGSQSLSLPELGVDTNFPSIAFIIPDLEAFAQLTLTEVGTGQVKACVQATLSNAHSTHLPAVQWGIGGLALFTLLVATWQSTRAHTTVPYRLLDLLHLYQTIATSGLLGLNYPSLYRAYTLNFAWAMGLVSKFQPAIDNMRALTGGNMANSSAGSAVGFVDRSLSPWNTGIHLASSPQSLLVDAAPTNLTLARIALEQLATVEGQVQTVTTDSSNVLQAGVPIYVNSIHIGSANAFMTIFLVALIAVAVGLGIAALGYAALYAAQRFRWARVEKLRYSYPAYLRAWALRSSLVGVPPITLFAFYQWSLKDSWLSVLLSVLAVLAIWSFVIHSGFLTLRRARREGAEELVLDVEHVASHGPLFAQYRAPRYYFFLLPLLAIFVRAVVIAAGEKSGMAQVILFLIVELTLFVSHILLKPYKSRGGDVLSTYLALVRLVCAGLMIAFVESIGVAPIPRVVIGAVIVVVFSVAVLVLAINIFLHSGILWAWRHRRSVRSPSLKGSADASMLEKGQESPIESNVDHSATPSIMSRTRLSTSSTHH
ncbi:hypothetical protein FB45DRAFT_782154 [Roridomyces roridus]|uniref:ML-like domain-containing protein n=1 Tax=Roridomyces roridus TaxID=1738132 RepID=A0AAD7CFX4_9AGAR|nr:hypothetical protein FB45DRAFT_782154 [Roridomyces roridus]